MYRCVYCGNEYQKKREQCKGCGSRKFTWHPKDLPLRTIYKGQKPPPKRLPSLRPLGGGEDYGVLTTGETLYVIFVCLAVMAAVTLIVIAWIGGGG